MSAPNWPLIAQVRELADGTRSSIEIAALLGRHPRHIRKILLRHDLPRLSEGARHGDANHQFETGRRINLNGYAMVSAPGHPHAKAYGKKRTGWVFEHRLVLEQKLGRHLSPSERVDHIDGLTLHNAPDNLRLFASNADHLRATLTGQVPHWSEEGYQNMSSPRHRLEASQRVDTHHRRRAAGAARLRQILRLALQLGTDSPYLLGTRRHTTKAGIDMSSRSTIEHALADLCRQWGWPPPL